MAAQPQHSHVRYHSARDWQHMLDNVYVKGYESANTSTISLSVDTPACIVLSILTASQLPGRRFPSANRRTQSLRIALEP